MDTSSRNFMEDGKIIAITMANPDSGIYLTDTLKFINNI